MHTLPTDQRRHPGAALSPPPMFHKFPESLWRFPGQRRLIWPGWVSSRPQCSVPDHRRDVRRMNRLYIRKSAISVPSKTSLKKACFTRSQRPEPPDNSAPIARRRQPATARARRVRTAVASRSASGTPPRHRPERRPRSSPHAGALHRQPVVDIAECGRDRSSVLPPEFRVGLQREPIHSQHRD